MAIEYTKHAREMLILRGVKEELINNTINNPDQILSSREDKKIYLKDFGKNYLKLVVSEEDGNKIIITLHWLAKRRVKR